MHTIHSIYMYMHTYVQGKSPQISYTLRYFYFSLVFDLNSSTLARAEMTQWIRQ